MNKLSYFNLNGLKTKAIVHKIYDGDTITVIFGHPTLPLDKNIVYNEKNNIYKWRCRFNYGNAAEIRGDTIEERELAIKQRDHLRKLIPIGTEIEIHCYDFDKYGRILIDIFYNGNDIIQEMKKEFLINF